MSGMLERCSITERASSSRDAVVIDCKILAEQNRTRTDNTKDFSGTIYIGMLKLTNINLYTAPGYIYDMNILTEMMLTAGTAERNSLTVRYQFKYGLIYNYSYTDKKKVTNCTICQDF
jgi:hypothetical protein